MLHVFWDHLSCNLLPCPWLPAHSHSQHWQRMAPSRRQDAATVISERLEGFTIGKYPSKSAERDISHLPPRSEVSRAGDRHFSAHPHPVIVELLLPWGTRTALGWGCACPAQVELPPRLL